ncbi:MAG TPA: sulfite exporter TauE/SafE family protein [Gemmatimonadaceae bacterium]|nr:sulfite exporter TauE/SafE family protein [Gemmatimonadaceae bacterium]
MTNAAPPAGPPRQSSFDLVLRAATGPVPTMTAAWLAAFALAFLHSHLHALLIGLGVIGSFVAGLVGVGGAVIMIPLLLYVPPAFGFAEYGIHTVTGVTLIQVAAAGVAGTLGHFHHQAIEKRLLVTLGGGMAAGALAGALVSNWVSAPALSGIFALLALLAALVMFVPPRPLSDGRPFSAKVDALAAGSGGAVGFFVGMVGAGGGFLLVPLMLYVLRVPLRLAVGTSLAIVTVSAISGSLGKVMTGQVDWLMALALVTGALPGARFGAVVSRHLPVTALRYILAGLLMVVAAKMWWELLR